MKQTVLFPAAVEHQIDHLTPLLEPVEVGGAIPNPRPDQFVVIERSGGSAMSIAHDTPMLTYKCTAPTIGQAEALASRVRAHVRAQEGFLTEIGGPVLLPDPDDGLPRFQFTAQIRIRGTAL